MRLLESERKKSKLKVALGTKVLLGLDLKMLLLESRQELLMGNDLLL